jgi:hypothetical protein
VYTGVHVVQPMKYIPSWYMALNPADHLHVKRHDAKQAFTVSTQQDTVETMVGQIVNAKQLRKHFNAVYTLAGKDL